MLNKISVKRKLFEGSTPQEVSTLVKGSFASDGWYVLETPLHCSANRLPLPENWHAHCLSLVVFNEQAELKVEPEGGSLVCRLLREDASGARPEDGEETHEAYVRETDYLLRRHEVTAPMFRENLGKLRHREYFTLDKEDGMPTLFESRLCGFAAGTKGGR